MAASDPPPASSPAPTSTPPASQPPASQSAPPTPATADTINQALDAVKTTFPPDSTILSDLQLTASDDDTASVTVIVNDQASNYGTDGILDVLSAIWDQFASLNIPQGLDVSYCVASDPSTLYSLDDLAHNWAIIGGAAPDSSPDSQ
jgi:hypothetical protein